MASRRFFLNFKDDEILKKISTISLIWLASGCLFGSCYNPALAAESSTGKSEKSGASAVNSRKDASKTASGSEPGESKAAASKSSSSKTKSSSASKEKIETAEAISNKSSSSINKSNNRNSSRRQVRSSQMVPPPPPVVPTFSVGAGMAPSVVLGGELIEYMSSSDLKDLHTKTERDLSKAKTRLKEETESIADKQKRALSFQALYAEGVVSRKELELCKKEAENAGSDLEDVKLLVAELEQKFSRIEKRLKELKAKAETVEKKKKTR